MVTQGSDEHGGTGLGGTGEGDFRDGGDVRAPHGLLGGDLVHTKAVGDGRTASEGDAAGFHVGLGPTILTPATMEDGQDNVTAPVEPLGQGVGLQLDEAGAR